MVCKCSATIHISAGILWLAISVNGIMITSILHGFLLTVEYYKIISLTTRCEHNMIKRFWAVNVL